MNNVAVLGVEKKKEFKLKKGGSVLLDISEEACRRFGNFSPGQSIKRMSRGLPKRGESLDLWKGATVLYEAIVVGVANNPKAKPEYFGRECLWFQEAGQEFVACYPPEVTSAEDFENIGVIAV